MEVRHSVMTLDLCSMYSGSFWCVFALYRYGTLPEWHNVRPTFSYLCKSASQPTFGSYMLSACCPDAVNFCCNLHNMELHVCKLTGQLIGQEDSVTT